MKLGLLGDSDRPTASERARAAWGMNRRPAFPPSWRDRWAKRVGGRTAIKLADWLAKRVDRLRLHVSYRAYRFADWLRGKR